jgi:chemotaxis protein MotB
MTMERLLRHVVTRVTDEGLVIEVFDLDDAPLFDADSAQPSETLRNIAMLLAEVLAITTNKVAVNGHIRSYPVTLIDNPVWDLSANRAQAMRVLLEDAGMAPARLDRVTGHADRKPVTDNPAAKRNNRIEVILLRENR